MIIDAHHHYWKLSRGDYTWLTPSLTVLYRDFLPPDLVPELEKHKINDTILVQAADSLNETRYLLDLAEKHSHIRGVVGWINMAAEDAVEELESLAQHPELLGIRPMLQDLPDTEWILRPELEPAFRALIDLNLTFDALIRPQHLAAIHTLCQRYPELKVVVDHGAKPAIAQGEIDTWSTDLRRLAAETPSFCKLSGLLPEARPGAYLEDLRPYIDVLFDAFGPDRLIWGSDWPVVNLTSNYGSWLSMAQAYVQHSCPEEADRIFGRNAAQFYSLTPKRVLVSSC